MSATLARNPTDMASASATFSYAEAAKGRSPSGLGVVSSKPDPTALEAALERPGQNAVSEHVQDSSDAVTTEDGNDTKRLSDDTKSGNESDPQSDLNTGAATVAAEVQQPSEPQAKASNVSVPSSPSFGTTSGSTVLKDDDVFAASNESSESTTWEKVSEDSHNEEKSATKAEGDGDDAKLSSWEHVSAPAPLKEAPPPTFNIWQKRAMDAQAKAKELRTAALGTTTTANGDGMAKRTPDAFPEINHRRPKPSASENAVTNSKDPIMSIDGRSRSTEEGRAPHRSSRSPGDAKVVAPASMPPPQPPLPPPPPSDAISWPTPDLAVEGDKKKAHDRSERVERDKTPSKPHGKEKWVSVPYVPTAVFNTPLPIGRRGGRPGGRGGREGDAGRGSVSHGVSGGDRGQAPVLSSDASAPTSEKGKLEMGPPQGTGSSMSKSKRAASAGPITSREQRKTYDSRDKDGTDSASKSMQSSRPPPSGTRRTSTSVQTESGRQGTSTEPRESNSNGSEQVGPVTQDQRHSRANTDRSSTRPNGFHRETNGFLPREGRSERARGGFRSRGGNSSFGGHNAMGQSFANGQLSSHGHSGYQPSKTQSFAEQRHSSHPQAGPYPTGREQRHYRANSHSQPITNSQSFGGKYTTGGGPSSGAPHLPQLQTDIANMYALQPGPPGIMSAVPYHPYMEQMQLQGMVQMQMEYYFSVDNLCKDLFLRKHMDSQGFVFLHVLLNFNRIKQLTSDIDLIRFICLRSPAIELQTGTDGLDRVRKAQEWDKWVLAMNERDSTVQNDGPLQLVQQPQLPIAHVPTDSHSRNAISPRSFMGSSHRYGSWDYPKGNDTVAEGQHHPGSDDVATNNTASELQSSQTPLSATVPDFKPALQNVNSHALEDSSASPQAENHFSDEQVENLTIVIRKLGSAASTTKALFPSAVSRTFSNGSIDGRTISAEFGSLDSTAVSSECDRPSERSRSPLASGSTTKPHMGAPSPVFWVKDKETPIGNLPSDLTHESYTVFRHNALQRREQSLKGQCHRDMDILFQFWSHFLVRNFNPRMYEEFRHLASDDAELRDSVVGLRNLVAYYDESILGQKVVSDELARDYVNVVQGEAGKSETPAFEKLRAAWRNGAFPLKNRVKIDKIIDPKLKEDLER